MLIAQKFRSSLDRDDADTAHAKMNKKVALLHQALLISQWISNVDPSSVNDCFDNQGTQVPTQLAQYDSVVNEDMKKIEDMKLSPNRVHTNDQLKAASNTIISGTGLLKWARLGKNAGVSPGHAGKGKSDVGLDPP